MTTMATWTGWDANALRKALRMSATDFAQHVGVARRTVAKWSSRGRDIQLRMELQSALDTVLGQASSEIQERFEQFRLAGSFGDASVDDRGGIDGNGDVRRRDLLAVGGVVAIPAVARLLDVLMPAERRSDEPATSSSVPELFTDVAMVKADYQACRYENALQRLVNLLPTLVAARSAADSDLQARIDVLAADVYHVVGSVLLKFGDHAMALVAAERCTRHSLDSGDPVAAGTSARLMTHALMRNGYCARAVRLAQTAADGLERATRLSSSDSLATYGALLLRGTIAAARSDDRDAAELMLAEASRAATTLGRDGNDRWTGFGPNNVLQHRASVALTFGDAGTAISLARQVQLNKVALAERRASLFVDVARAYTQWGRYEQGLSALRTAYRTAPEEIRSRPAVRDTVGDLAALARGNVQTEVLGFAATAGISL